MQQELNVSATFHHTHGPDVIILNIAVNHSSKQGLFMSATIVFLWATSAF